MKTLNSPGSAKHSRILHAKTLKILGYSSVQRNRLSEDTFLFDISSYLANILLRSYAQLRRRVQMSEEVRCSLH